MKSALKFLSINEARRFDGAAITPEAIAKVQAQVRERVLRLFKRRELLSPETVDTMREWGHEGGFLLNAEVICTSLGPFRFRALASLLRPAHLRQRAAAIG